MVQGVANNYIYIYISRISLANHATYLLQSGLSEWHCTVGMCAYGLYYTVLLVINEYIFDTIYYNAPTFMYVLFMGFLHRQCGTYRTNTIITLLRRLTDVKV